MKSDPPSPFPLEPYFSQTHTAQAPCGLLGLGVGMRVLDRGTTRVREPSTTTASTSGSSHQNDELITFDELFDEFIGKFLENGYRNLHNLIISA